MTKKISRAKALKAFIDKLSFPKANLSATMIQVIADSFTMKADSVEFRRLLHTQIENFDALLHEIQLARMGEESKRVTTRRIQALSKFLLHPALYGPAEKARVDIINPNADQLYVVSDALDMFTAWDEQTKAFIDAAAEHLQEAYDSISNSDLDQKLKAAVLPTINALISLLRNFEVVGFDRAWEMASTTILVIHRQIEHAPTESDRRRLALLGQGVLRIASYIAGLDTIYKGAVSIGSGGASLYSYLRGSSNSVSIIEDETIQSGSADITSI